MVTQDTQPQHQQQHLPHPCVTWACPRHCAFGEAAWKPLRASVSLGSWLAAWRGGSKQPLPQAKSNTRVFSGGSRPQFPLAKHRKVHGQEEGAQDQEHPQSIQDKAPYVKCTKRPENPGYPSCCSYAGCLGMQHPVAAGTSAPSSTDRALLPVQTRLDWVYFAHLCCLQPPDCFLVGVLSVVTSHRVQGPLSITGNKLVRRGRRERERPSEKGSG